jgi:ATP-dependent phosphofructokinase / diphosphate-dependent phosphofructokinase
MRRASRRHRVTASWALVFGVAATDLVAKQQFARMVRLKAGKMELVSLDEALEKMKFIDPCSEIVHAARAVGATFGDSA